MSDLLWHLGCSLYYCESYRTEKHDQLSPVTAATPLSWDRLVWSDQFKLSKPECLALLLNINIYMREDMEHAFMSISVRLDSLEEVIEEKAGGFFSEADSETE